MISENYLKIIVIGAVDFSYSALEYLISNNHNIVGVITKKISKINSDFKELTPLAKENNIPIFYREKDNNSELLSFIKNSNANIIYCFGWSHLLRKDTLNSVKHGVVGFHPAALPNNRGRHPLIWAIVLGLSETASTFFFMDEGADTGDIISQEKVSIDFKDSAATLYKKIIDKAILQIQKFTRELNENQGNIKRISQKNMHGNYWRKRGIADGLIDFRMSSKAIYNLVRALSSPYPGAHLIYNNEEIKIWETEIVEEKKSNFEPGKVLSVNEGFIIVKTYDKAIKLTNHEFNTIPEICTYL